jgi:hypothetical protein
MAWLADETFLENRLEAWLGRLVAWLDWLASHQPN